MFAPDNNLIHIGSLEMRATFSVQEFGNCLDMRSK
jgi:hypothetical protein